jgi:hypothetical protein
VRSSSIAWFREEEDRIMQSLIFRRAYAVLVWALVALGSVGSALPARAAPLFTEDFESYAPGSNLVGQNGWVEALGGGSLLTVANGTLLPTQVLDGFAIGGGENMAKHAVPINPSAITTLRFQAYATTAGPTHNSEVGFTSSGFGFGQPFAAWESSLLSGHPWEFDAAGNRFFVQQGGYDRPVSLEVVIDGVSDALYGRYNFGGGFIETPHVSVSPAQLATLNGVGLFVDHRGYPGMEIDNLRIFDSRRVPEPASLLLLGSGVAGLVWLRRRQELAAFPD